MPMVVVITRDVESLLTYLADAAHHHIFDEGGIYPRTLDHFPQHHRREHHRMHIFQ